MAEKSAVDVLNSHHTKLNEHTKQIADLEARMKFRTDELQARINELDKRLASVETDHKPFRDFMQKINDWVGTIKD